MHGSWDFQEQIARNSDRIFLAEFFFSQYKSLKLWLTLEIPIFEKLARKSKFSFNFQNNNLAFRIYCSKLNYFIWNVYSIFSASTPNGCDFSWICCWHVYLYGLVEVCIYFIAVMVFIKQTIQNLIHSHKIVI